MSILLKNLLLFLKTDKQRHVKDVVNGLERLIELNEIDKNLILEESLQEMKYSYRGEDDKKLITLEEVLNYYNEETPSIELNNFLIKHYNKIPTPDVFLSSLENSLINLRNTEEDLNNFKKELTIIPKDILMQYLKIENMSSSDFYEKIKELDDEIRKLKYVDRVKHSSQELDAFEERIVQLNKEQDDLSKRKERLKIQEKIFTLLLSERKKLSIISEYLSKEFVLTNYSNFCFNSSNTKMSMVFNDLINIENIIPGFLRTQHRFDSPIYEIILGASLKSLHSALLEGPDFFSAQEIKKLEDRALYLVCEQSYRGHSDTYKFRTLLNIDNWYSKKLENGSDMISFALKELCSIEDSYNFEQIISLTKDDEEIQKYLLEREENILTEMLIYSTYRISFYNNLIKIIPELLNKPSGKLSLLENISSVYNTTKGMINKKNKVLDKVSDNLLIGNNEKEMKRFFTSEKWNISEVQSSEELKLLLNSIMNRLKLYNERTNLIEPELFNNLYNWEENINSKNVTGQYGYYQNIENDIIKILLDSKLPVSILEKLGTIREMKKNENKGKVIDVTFEKIKILESLNNNQDVAQIPKKRM